MKSAEHIVNELMYGNDAFSKWLGIEVVKVSAGSCILKMKVRSDMLNGFKIAHGGISYSLADSALAFASNSHGRQAVSVETSVSHTKAIKADDILTATTSILKEGKTFSIYQIKVSNQNNDTVALFKGTVYYTGKDW